MPLKIPPQELDSIIQAMKLRPDGASVSELMKMPELDFTKRTLQRRLNQLIDEERLVPEGEGRGRRYVLPVKTTQPTLLRETPPCAEEPDWLSPEAIEIRESVNRSVTARTPVGYQSEFLECYQPNTDAYLSPELRCKLAEMGQVGICDLPAGTYLRQVMDRLLIDLSWNSSRLEGNTYSLLETQCLVEHGENANGKNAEETQMILNHKAAIEMLADQATEIGFNRYTVCNLHALLADNLLSNPAACGRLRSVGVGIGGTVYHPLAVPQAIEEQFIQILNKAEAIDDPFEQAFFVMVHLPYLQPFEDVNKRVSRLAANIPLVKHNLCPLSFIDVSQEDYIGGLIGVYELNRVEYLRDVFVWAYQRSCAHYSAIRQSLGDPDPFRLRYRTLIGQFVREVVQDKMCKNTAEAWIAVQAKEKLAKDDFSKFIAVIEIELNSLHIGNIARYRLRPKEFEAWKRGWE